MTGIKHAREWRAVRVYMRTWDGKYAFLGFDNFRPDEGAAAFDRRIRSRFDVHQRHEVVVRPFGAA